MERRDVKQGSVKTYPAPDHHPPVQTELRPGWHVPEHLELPEPTYWPAVLALGITFIAWSFVTSYIIFVVGLILFALALAGWIGDIHHEHH
jgi:hypothetical protein